MAPFVFTALCIIASLAVAALLYAVSRLTKRYGAGRSRGSEEGKQLVLPPGSMGLPLIGETIQLYSQNPGFFFSNRLKSYGEIFKTHVLGCPCVVLANAEAARMVLVTKAHLFRPTYPPSKMRLLGPSALFYHQGDYHLRLRRLVQGAMSPDALRALVPDVEAAVAATLAAWEARRVESTFDAMKRLAFDVGVATLFAGRLDQQCKEELNRSYCIVERGYNSFANRLPFTRYRRAIQARERLREILAHIVAERRAQSDLGRDLLGSLMRSRDGAGAPLSDDQVADNVIGLLFAAQDTTASVLTWILKYLNDNPKLLEAVKAEQMAAYQENGGGTRPLTWAQTKRMAVTHRVILESLRMASIISFTFREAVADVEYKGFLIPKGWKVMPLFRSIHHNPEYFQDPQKFDPSRFKVSPRPGTFLPFGSGVHACPGNELAKLEMLVLVHRLVTGYRWEVVGSSDDVEYRPFPVPRRGLKARLWRQEKAGVHAAASA